MLLGLVLAACSSATFDGSIYRHADVQYRVGRLPAGWSQLKIEDAQLAFRHAEGGTLLANAWCGTDHIEDLPLDVLTNHLLFGVEATRTIQRTPFSLDARAALRSHIVGTMDGVPVELDLVVVKKDGCTYDFQLVTGVTGDYEKRRPDFEAFYGAFQRLPGSR